MRNKKLIGIITGRPIHISINNSKILNEQARNYIRENLNNELKLLPNYISVLIDSEDGFYTVADLYAKHFNFVLRSHYNSIHKYDNNVYPWAFGISERMINTINETKNTRLRIQRQELLADV
jgi:hypothetical protein